VSLPLLLFQQSFAFDAAKYQGGSYDGHGVGTSTSQTFGTLDVAKYYGGSYDGHGLGTSSDDLYLGVLILYAGIKVWLEGPYQTGGSMTTALKTAGFIPTTSPYADARTVTAVPDGITDWGSVELRSSASGPSVAQRSFFLRSNGSIVDTDGTTTDLEIPGMADGSYYIVVRHRNHLAVMSAEAQALNSSSPSTYDFTSGIAQYYGTDPNRAKQVESGVYGMNAGDANGSGTVDASDRSTTWNGRNQSGYLNADCNLSGTVDASDRSITWNNRNKSTNIP
jgi:hypothetical protein